MVCTQLRSYIGLLFLVILITSFSFPAASANEGRPCLFAGWPSQTNQAGQCLSPSQIANSGISSLSLRCPGGGVQCNPAYFGKARNGNPICVGGSGVAITDYTQACLDSSPHTASLIKRYRTDSGFQEQNIGTLGRAIGQYCAGGIQRLECQPELQLIEQRPGGYCFRGQEVTAESMSNFTSGMSRVVAAVTGLSLAAIVSGAALQGGRQPASEDDEEEDFEEFAGPSIDREGSTSNLSASHTTGGSSSGSGGQDIMGALESTLPCSDCRTEDSFSMGDAGSRVAIRGESQTTWNECGSGPPPSGPQSSNFQERQITGYYLATPNSCNRMTISSDLKQFMQNNLAQCVSDSLSQEGLDQPISGIVIGHRGITGDSNHSSRSLHAINRAIDIATLHIQLENGEVLERSANGQQNTNPHQDFYANFRRCWSEKIDSDHAGVECPGSFPKGSIGAEDGDHRGHIHLSLPHCPSRGFFHK